MRLKVHDVHEVCMKYPGMWDAFWAVGKLDGDCIELPREAFEDISARFLPSQLGTRIHAILAPVAKAIDQVAGTNWEGCEDCAGRELRINAG